MLRAAPPILSRTIILFREEDPAESRRWSGQGRRRPIPSLPSGALTASTDGLFKAGDICRLFFVGVKFACEIRPKEIGDDGGPLQGW